MSRILYTCYYTRAAVNFDCVRMSVRERSCPQWFIRWMRNGTLFDVNARPANNNTRVPRVLCSRRRDIRVTAGGRGLGKGGRIIVIRLFIAGYPVFRVSPRPLEIRRLSFGPGPRIFTVPPCRSTIIIIIIIAIIINIYHRRRELLIPVLSMWHGRG